MNQKLPYYMAYPMPLAYDDERTERMDFEYMKSLYPDIPKRILPYVEEECDRMEYENSMVFDEYPDKLQLRLMCGRIYENVRKNEKMFYGTSYVERTLGYEGMSRGTEADMPEEETLKEQGGRTIEEIAKGVSGTSEKTRGGLRDLIEVMLYQELYKRRCDNRRRKRRFY